MIWDLKAHSDNADNKGLVINTWRWGGGGLQNGGRGVSEVLALRKGGGEKVLVLLKGGGGTKSFKVVLTRELEVLAILKWGEKGFNPLKWGAQKKSCPRFSRFVPSPLPVINDRSLSNITEKRPCI